MIATKYLFSGLESYFVFALWFCLMSLTKVSFGLFLPIHQLLQADGCKSERLMCGVAKRDKHHSSVFHISNGTGEHEDD